MNQRTDRKELESLRVTLARIAQMLSVQSIVLPVLVDREFGAISKLARERDRGWNALGAAITGKLQTMAENNLYALRAVAGLAIDYLNDISKTLADVEKLLLSVSSIVPPGARQIYQRAVSALSEPGDAYTNAKVHLKTLWHWAEYTLGGLNAG